MVVADWFIITGECSNASDHQELHRSELIIVVVILGILVAIAIPIFANIQTTAQTNALKAAAANGATAAAASIAQGASASVSPASAAASAGKDGISVTITGSTIDTLCATAAGPTGWPTSQKSGPGC